MLEQRKTLNLLILILFLSLASCRQGAPMPPTQTPEFSTENETPSATSTLTPSQTVTPTATFATPTLSHSPTPTPTPTTRWEGRGLSLTPLPPISERISIHNTDRVHILAVWGSAAANDIALSPDGQILAVGTNIGCYLYNSTSLELITLLETASAVQSIAFSADNQFIALGQVQDTIEIFQRDGYGLVFREILSDWDLPSEYQINLYFSSNDAQLISIIKTETDIFINRWVKNSWQFGNAFSMDSGRAFYVNIDVDLLGVFSEDNLTLQSITYPDESEIISLPNAISPSFWEEFSLYQGDIAPTSDGRATLINNGSSIIHWQIQAEDLTYRLEDYPDEIPDPCLDAPDTCLNTQGGFSWACDDEPNIPPIEMIALSPENYMVLISLHEGRSEFRRAEDGLLSWEIDSNYTKVTFSPRGDFFFGLTPRGGLEKRATLDGSLMDIIHQHPSQLHDIDFSPDGSELAAGYNDGYSRVYSTANGQMLGVLNGGAQSLEFSPDNQLLAAGLEDGTIRIFELMEARHFDLGDGHADAVTDLTFSPDGTQLITGSDDCTASLWDLQDRYRVQTVKPDIEDPFRIKAINYSPALLRQYFCGERDGLYAADGRELGELMFYSEDPCRALALSPDEKSLAFTGPESWLLPSNTSPISSSGQPLHSELKAEGYTLAYTLDGSLLIIATDQGLAFWSVVDGELLTNLELFEPPQPGNLPVDLAVSPDGSLIALAHHSGLIVIYGIPEMIIE